MKKLIVLLILLTGLTRSFAQLPDGSIAPDFTVEDVNGNTWNLYQILGQGKTVILNIGAAWSGPDWNYHNSGALKNFYNQYGPPGDNTAMVLFVEGDPITSEGCLFGQATCNNNTQGNWVEGTPYPVIDDPTGSFITNYGINYYPTVYRICSDRTLKEVGQLTATQMAAAIVDCPVTYSSVKLITGLVVDDGNTNCIADSGEQPLANWKVRADGQNNFTVVAHTNANGRYNLFVDSVYSPYTLTFIPPNPFWESCPPPPPVVATAADTITYDHAATKLADCPYLVTDIGAPLLRRCFTNYFNVSVCNEGTAPANGSYVDVTLPSPEFSPISNANTPYTTLSPGLYRFELGNLVMGECVNIQFQATVSCDSVILGQTLCFEAHAYPDSLCAPEGVVLWNGAIVAVTSACNNGTPVFQIKNVGTGNMSSASNFIVIEDDVMVSEGNFLLNQGESYAIELQGSGSTWRVEAQQVPDYPVPGNPAAALEGCTGNASFSTGFVNTFPTYDPSHAWDVECMTVIGAYDPNDKTGFPLGITDEHLIDRNINLDYLIRFQNTGTDTAFNIVVRDTINTAVLDVNSIRPGVSSHPYDLTIAEGRILIFSFNNIQLVDSFKNEPASHGYVWFNIAQQPDLADGTVIDNSAAIYFDFNAPVITNTSQHRIGKIPHVSITQSTLPDAHALRVYPNPLGNATVLYTEQPMPDGSQWVLYDLNGRSVARGAVQGRMITIGHTLQASALYRIEFYSKQQALLGGATLVR